MTAAQVRKIFDANIKDVEDVFRYEEEDYKVKRRRTEYASYLDGVSSSISPCQYCERLKELGRGLKPGEHDTGLIPESSCEAFPDGIPRLIHIGQWDHSTNFYDGDSGMLFKNTEIITLDGKEYVVGWRGLPDPVEMPEQAERARNEGLPCTADGGEREP